MASPAKPTTPDVPTDFASVFRAAPGLYLLLTPDAPKYTIITASDAYATATCTRCEDMIGQGVFEASPHYANNAHSISAELFRSSLKQVMEALKAHEMEVQKYDMPCPPGQGSGTMEKYWSQLNTPVFNKDGKIEYIIHRIDDVTEKLRVEMALHDSEERFRDLSNAMPQGVWTANAEGRIDYINDRCYEYCGPIKTVDGVVDWAPLIHPDDLSATLRAWTESVRDGTPYEISQRIFHAQSASYRWNLTRALPAVNETGKIIRWYGTNTDIENQKQTEEALRISEQFTKSIIDSSPDCISVLDLDGHLLSLNEEGLRQQEIEDFSTCHGKLWSAYWVGTDRARAENAVTAAGNGETTRFEGFCTTMRGSPKWWEIIVTSIRDAHGIPTRLLVVSRDITERRRLETLAQEAHEQAEAANIAKSEFLANMSHEIRTPMNAVIGLAHILSRSEGLTSKQKEFVRTLQLSADSLLGLINDLLDISKIESRSIDLEHIPFSITQLLNEVISMMSIRAREKGLEFTMSGECNRHHMLIGDPTRLRQIVLNLCSNAIKFTEEGGVYVSISCEPAQFERFENVCIQVRDTGIGIAADKQDTIFHKFIQADSSINRKYGGTGLGLAITKTLTEIMGGTISIESEEGKGSTFTIRMPMMVGALDEEPALDATVNTTVERRSAPRHRVLLVEDYAANILVATNYLDLFGYSYDVVDNGYEAVEKAKDGHYLAILMDVQMHGINGFETTKLIRSHEQRNNLPRTPIIGMTAHALLGDRDRCLAGGMDDYLSKPYNPAELEAKLAGYATIKQNARA